MSCKGYLVKEKTPIGVVFDEDKRLAIALEEKEKRWGDGNNNTAFVTGTDALTDWNGKTNTKEVVKDCQERNLDCPAFEYVNNYATEGTSPGDWYLPAFGELNVIYENMGKLNTTLYTIGVSQMTTTRHWSSTKTVSGSIWYKSFSGNFANRNESFNVRPVLEF